MRFFDEESEEEVEEEDEEEEEEEEVEVEEEEEEEEEKEEEEEEEEEEGEKIGAASSTVAIHGPSSWQVYDEPTQTRHSAANWPPSYRDPPSVPTLSSKMCRYAVRRASAEATVTTSGTSNAKHYSQAGSIT
ncbi:hypothetical protein V1477_014800 [Vespula maculifrons]|uniref:Uncharacterized protein n=1 Tax=Vespula maculifrons TaxID=7453 RepID=A0ABD2BII5_VESMC